MPETTLTPHICRTCMRARWEYTAGVRPRVNTRKLGTCDITNDDVKAMLPIACRYDGWVTGVLYHSTKPCPTWASKEGR